MPYKDPQKNKEWHREWEKKNLHKRRKYRNKVKLKVYQKLGGKCVYCGCNNINALEINHKFGGGTQEIKKRVSNYAFYLDILAGRRTIEDLELTCRVCNAWHYLIQIRKIKGNWQIKWIPPTGTELCPCGHEIAKNNEPSKLCQGCQRRIKVLP